MKMKRLIYILLIVSTCVLAIAIFIKPIILFLAKKQLSRVFIESSIFIKGCCLKPTHQLALQDIEIKKDGVYDFRIKEIKFEYDLFSILKRNLTRFSLKEAQFTVNLGQKSIFTLQQYLKFTPRSLFLVKSLELANLNLILESKDLNLNGRVSTELNLIKRLINYCDLKLDLIEGRGFQLKNASLKVSGMLGAGNLYIQQIKYNKAGIEEIAGKASLENKALFLHSLSAQILDGQVQGDLTFSTDKVGEYLANLKFIDLNLKTFVKEFNLDEKLEASGRISGTLVLNGKGTDINILSGDFSAVAPGGILTIKDTKFLENRARNTGQSLDILVESFKDYHYNKGMMKLSLNEGNLILDIALDGEKGSRNLNIILHDFKLGKEVL